jgi:predicted dehydrogenase
MAILSRRAFLHESGLFAAATAAAAQAAPLATTFAAADENKGGAAERLRVAVVGVHGRGMSHVNGFAGKNNCAITTICDCDEAVIGSAMKQVEKTQGTAPRFEQDIRKVVEDKNIDVVSIATPNHWHALAAIWALQNGKHVYVEKPVSHNVSEGRRIVEAARKANRICQAGTQSRSMPGMRAAIDYLRSGKLGTVKLARALCYKDRKSIGKVNGEQQIPKSIDYNLWCGPAPMKPLTRKNLHYDWHWVWDTGNGDLGNQGIHEMDKMRWGMGKSELPSRIFSLGGRFGYIDDGETANTQICVFGYDDCEMIFEVRGLPSVSPFPNEKDKKGGNYIGNIWYGSKGYLVCPSYSSGTAFNLDGEKIQTFGGPGSEQLHFDNFVKAVRSGKVEDLNGDILEGHLSSAMCHLGNISYRLGTSQPFASAGAALPVDKDGSSTFDRMKEHLADNKIALGDTPCRVGQKLVFDSATEKFRDNRAADAQLTREYRKGFEVPAKI